MSDTVIQQTLIAHNDQWKRKNEAILDEAERLKTQRKSWEALVQMAMYDASEIRRLQIWASTLREYPAFFILNRWGRHNKGR